MPYSAEISRDNPTALLFVIDQSGSMDEKMTTGRSKADFVADVLNKQIYTLVTNCTKADGVRNYFDVGVIAYGGSGVGAGLGGALSGKVVHAIAELASSPLRVEDRTRLEDDGAGGVLERKVKFPMWFLPTSAGGTPMCAGLTKAAEELVVWCDTHPNSYPPTVLHITDGASTDGDPEHVSNAIRQIATNDGQCLLFNLHVSTHEGETVQFPNSDASLGDSYGKLLFRMSSILPPYVSQFVVDFFDIGTRPRLAADR